MEILLQSQHTVLKNISNFITNTNKIGKDKQTETYIQARVDLLRQYWEKFQSNHSLLLQQAKPADLESTYFKDNTFDSVEVTYCENIGILHKMLKIFQPSTASEQRATNSEQKMCPTHNNLPKINIPRFGGVITQWPAFFDLFKSLIHSRTDLSGSQKLFYLKGNLYGPAEQLIRNISITDANYASAWKILHDRYQNSRVLVSSYLRMLHSLPSMKMESADELKNLFDATMEAVKALEGLGRPVNHWDDWLILIITQRLDSSTRKDWEDSISNTTEPSTFQALCDFLQSRIHTLEAVAYQSIQRDQRSKPKYTFIKAHHTSTVQHCSKCSGKHFLLFCHSFKRMPLDQRREFVKTKNLCFNCLRDQHFTANCPSANRCKHCNKMHHSCLHQEPNSSTDNKANLTNISSTSSYADTFASSQLASSSAVASFTVNAFNQVLLATARVLLKSPDGNKLSVRALLDQGSQATFISTNAATRLRLSKTKINIGVSGIGSCEAAIARSKVILCIQSCVYPDFELETDALVLPKLTNISAPKVLNLSDLAHLKEIQLADPGWYDNSPIDLILGADNYHLILREGIRQGLPTAQHTALGWILSGPVESIHHTQTSKQVQAQAFTTSVQLIDLDYLIRKFWEIEEVPSISTSFTEEEEACEEYYRQTTIRNAEGRYVVRLPIKSHYSRPLIFGDTRSNAVRCLYSMERRFNRDTRLRERYIDFMTEYLSLNHMKCVQNSQTFDEQKPFFLPHHGVLRENSVTTKLRVVFNGSKKGSSGSSLNDYLAAGPALQRDLTAILLRWRKHSIVFAADIKQMFRQILVHQDDTILQQIVWRDSLTDPIQEYRLLTVTYGTTSAPYLANRTLLQLAEDEREKYPLGSEILLHDCYVDDILTGADNVNTAFIIQQQLIALLKSGGFSLHKWASNSQPILNAANSHSSGFLDITDRDHSVTKTLGLLWNQAADAFEFQICLSESPAIITKRNILSDVAKLYDPLGLLAPSILLAKSKFQELWLEKNLHWDSPVSHTIATDWLLLRNELVQLEEISVPRWIGWRSTNCSYEVHVFSDASEKAYAAVAYLRVYHELDNIQISLLYSKTKLAPIKRISIPRLELSGALLMARLIKTLESSIIRKDTPVYCWTDSQIVLAWLHSHPSKWKPFVANRCSQIHELVPSAHWQHVPSTSNPADCASRGVKPSLLANLNLWWQGPSWLKLPSTMWPNCSQTKTNVENINAEERKSTIITHVTGTLQFPWNLLDRYSNLQRLLRITAYCQRFIYNLRCNDSIRKYSQLSATDLEASLLFWIRQCQQNSFSSEFQSLSKGKQIKPTSPLIRLSPFYDKYTETLRVGGRLQNSTLSADAKHQFILAKNSRLSDLIIDDAHRRTLHGGTNLTLNLLRQRYWILSCRDKIRRFIQRCVTCFRQRASARSQLMGILPVERVTPSRPFSHTGLDYAGPVQVRHGPGRGRSSYKAYIALFVCMSTKAVHIELVSGLTTAAFIAAYKRFTARRGLCARIYSDNAKTFVGADRELQQSFFTLKGQLPDQLASLLAHQGTLWHFIPPNAPNFGGLWEAGVKAIKHHLKRVVGDTTLTFEEFYTLLTLIEACLNSRPLYSLSADSQDAEALTPGHFLMGSAPLTVPEPNLTDIKLHALSRWQLVQKMYGDFWHRWSNEYLNNLQVRTKWTTSSPNVEVGTVVIVKDEKLPPSQWAIGKIHEVIRGPDDLVRVVMVYCRGIILKRPISKICPLPLSNDSGLNPALLPTAGGQ